MEGKTIIPEASSMDQAIAIAKSCTEYTPSYNAGPSSDTRGEEMMNSKAFASCTFCENWDGGNCNIYNRETAGEGHPHYLGETY